MHTVLLKFTFEDPETIDFDLSHLLISNFRHGGRLIDYFDYPVIQNNTVIYSGVIIRPDALDISYYTPSVLHTLLRYREEFNITFEYEITGHLPRRTISNIHDVSAFILYEGGPSPVRTLDTFANVPLYLLPKTNFHRENHDNILCWARSYDAIWGNWFRGNVDEPYFYDQLTKYNSALSQEGIEICKTISSLTNIDCYYHLFNDPNPDVPDFENCPKCNSPWKMEEEIFDTFKYKCNNCFLIS